MSQREDNAHDDEAFHDEDEAAGDEEAEDVGDAKPWTGLARLPEKADVVELLKELRSVGRRQLSVLLLGKSNVGKSSIVNSLFGEQAVRVQAFKLQADAEVTTTVVRQVAIGDPEVDGFRVRLIDTCGLEDPEAGDTVNYGALSKIAEDIRGVPIDVVLYVDRLDLYRVDPLDKAIIAAIGQTFGSRIWRRTVVALTHANLAQTPPGTTYDTFADGRIRLIRGAIRGRGLLPNPFRPALPVCLVENSELCPLSPESGARVLPDGTEWLPGLVGELADTALARGSPYRWHPRLSRKPGQRLAWLLPLVVAGELLFYQRVLRPRLDDNQRRVEAAEDLTWSVRGQQRKAMGLHPPNRPDGKAAWRLEQMYDDD